MMKSLKSIFLVCFVLTIVLSSLFLSSAQESEKSMTIKYSLQSPLDPILTHEAAFARAFKNAMEVNTNYRIKVDLYPSNVLGTTADVFKMVQRGTVEMAWSAAGALAQFYPLTDVVLGIPFLYPSYSVGWKVFQGDLFQKEVTNDVLEKTGVRVVSWPFYGFYVLTNSKKPVHSPEDLKGLRIRCMATPIHLKIFETLGAKATSIAWPEVYGALQTGVVDGQHNAITAIPANKLYEVQKYVTLTNHLAAVSPVLVNDEWFQSLSESDRLIFWDAIKIAETACLGAVRIGEISEETGIPYLLKQGMEIYTPSPKEMEEFREKVGPVIDKYIDEQFGEEGNKWLEKLKNAARIAEDEVKKGNLW